MYKFKLAGDSIQPHDLNTCLEMTDNMNILFKKQKTPYKAIFVVTSKTWTNQYYSS